MTHSRLTAWLGLSLISIASACSGDSTGPMPIADPEFSVHQIASGLNQPVHVTAAPGDARLFVVERPGVVRTFTNGVLDSSPWLDIRSRVGTNGEGGLLSIAFSPNYASTREVFVNFTGHGGETRVERIPLGPNGMPNTAASSAVLTIQQPASNHNGGMLQFGPDGYLYVGMGDGGGGGDPFGNGQNRSTLLGSMLRVDVESARPYAVPSDNPFIGQAGTREEIWAIGLRNPWRFSFDRDAGTLYIADVGQEEREEINARPSTEHGLNYGWKTMEGSRCYNASSCDQNGLTLPVMEYDHSNGNCSVTGGVVYRGDQIPSLVGHYLYADFCAGVLRSFYLDNGVARSATEWTDLGRFGSIVGLGADPNGEVYFVTIEGRLYRVEPAAS